MFGRIAGLRSRNLTRRPLEYRAASFSQLMRALETIERTRQDGVVLRASTIRLIAPIVFEETVTYPSGFAGVRIYSDLSIVHEVAAGVTTVFEVAGDYHEFSMLNVEGGTNFVALTENNTVGTEIRRCRVNATNIWLGGGFSNTRTRIEDNNALSSVVLGQLGAASFVRGNVLDSIDANAESISSCHLTDNYLGQDIIIDGGGTCVVTDNLVLGDLDTSSGSGSNIVDSNIVIGTLTTHGSDTAGDNE